MSQMSKMAATAAVGAVLLNAGLSFVAPGTLAPRLSDAATLTHIEGAAAPSSASAAGVPVMSMALLATAAAGMLAHRASKVARKALHGRKFAYSLQKDAYADLEFLNDVGYLPDGTPMNRAGNAIDHPENIGPDPHVPGSPLPRAEFTNSIGYLPDGTPMNRAGNAINHPENIQPDMHTPGSALPSSHYSADVGYLVDGTDLVTAGNNAVRATAAPPAAAPATPPPAAPPASPPTSVAAGFTSTSTDTLHGRKFAYALQKDAYADLEFLNDVGYLPDGTPLNMAGNNINHPENIGPDPHVPGSPLPRAIFTNSIGYLPDGTPMNMAGNAINHPENIQPDVHAPGSPLPSSYYYADVGYLVDGTDLISAGNNSVKGGAAAPPTTAVAAAFVGSSAPAPVATAPAAAAPATGTTVRKPGGFMYAVQKDAYADLVFGNDVGYLPDGTPMNTAGNAVNHPENIGPDPHTPGSPLPRAIFVNDVGYLPDGTPLNRAGNAINHPENIGPDPHTPGSPLPTSEYAADIGYLVDGTDIATAGNNAVH